jgi:hypothetical protein
MATLQRPTITLVFKGLMVLHKDKDGQRYEVGILNAPKHKFRINVTSRSPRGIKHSSIDLKPAPGEIWRLYVQDPVDREIREYRGEEFSRSRDDIRWLIDLESKEFHPTKRGAADRKLKAELLNPVFHIENGVFYTRVKSKLTERRKGSDPFEPFGFVAEEIGVDIELKSGNAVLVVEGTEEEIFRLEKNGDVTHEVVIDNSPEIEDDKKGTGSGHGSGHEAAPPTLPATAPGAAHHGAAAPTPLSSDHFQFYYSFFPEPEDKRFQFRLAEPVDGKKPPTPQPDPLLCPMVLIGRTLT